VKGLGNRRRDLGGEARTRRLAWTVLALWVVTEATGVKMLHTFIHRGGMHDEHVDTTYPAGLVANATLGSAASALWVLFLGTRRRSLAWAAVAQFGAAIAAGTALAIPWHLAERTGRPSRRAGGPEALRYSRAVEAGHAVSAWATAVLAGVVARRP
jgi:hypothetical protein